MREIKKEWEKFSPYFDRISKNKEIPDRTKDQIIFYAGAHSLLRLIFADGVGEKEVERIILENNKGLTEYLKPYFDNAR